MCRVSPKTGFSWTPITVGRLRSHIVASRNWRAVTIWVSAHFTGKSLRLPVTR